MALAIHRALPTTNAPASAGVLFVCKTGSGYRHGERQSLGVYWNPRLAALITACPGPRQPGPQVKTTLDGRVTVNASVAAMALVLGLACAATACTHPPDDAGLLRQFHDNRKELDALLEELLTNPRMADLEMAHSLRDGLAAYNVSSAESQSYAQKLRKAGVQSVSDHHRIADRYPIYFVVYEYYLYHDGIQKGFAWSEASPGMRIHVVDRLDGRSRSEGEAFRPIEGNWYLFVRPL